MKLNQDIVPSNLEEALKLLKEALTKNEVKEIKPLDSSELHFTLGMYLRNQWSLWESKSIIVKWFKKTYGVNHADDISGIILECLINDLNELPRKDKEVAAECIAHWKKYKK